MRLTLVISSLTAGGAERVLTILANAWVGQGHDVTLVTTHDTGAPPHYPLDARVRLDSVASRAPTPLKQVLVVRSLTAAIRRSDPDVVVSFLNYVNVLTLAACRGLHVPVVVSERADPVGLDIGPTWSFLRRRAYRRADRLVAQTQTAAAFFEPMAPGRIRVIPNPVQKSADIGNAPPEVRDQDQPTIIAVGRLHYLKGYDFAIRAMSLLAPDLAHWRLLILGEGPARQELEALRDELGLHDRVLMPGQVAEPGPWLRGAGIYLMSSRTEGFPNALCEAMAAGLPVISTNCPSGPADIITDGVDGILVESESPQAIATALDRLVRSPELCHELAAAAPGVVRRFSLESVLAAWNTVLLEAAPHARKDTER
jgi:glycosyltransferase involved in cell wall biosynthesis